MKTTYLFAGAPLSGKSTLIAFLKSQRMIPQDAHVFETTLSSKEDLDWLTQLKANGHEVIMTYVGTQVSQTNATYLMQRVEEGGPDMVVAEMIERRQQSLANLRTAASLVDQLILVDNSIPGDPPVMLGEREHVTWHEAVREKASFFADWDQAIRQEMKVTPYDALVRKGIETFMKGPPFEYPFLSYEEQRTILLSMSGNVLIVLLYGHKAGTLYLDRGNMRFVYDWDYLHQSHAPPLSQSLPLQEEPFLPWQTIPFFCGLLPEESERSRLARVLQVSYDDDFAMLKAIGGDMAGAVTLIPTDEPAHHHAPDVHWLDETQLGKVLAELPASPLLTHWKGMRQSLAGAQSKLAVVFDGERIGLPLHGAPSTHILKPDSPVYDNLAINEAFCMRLAAAVGIDAAHVRLIDTPKGLALLVERYDRWQDEDGTWHCLHQEDFCQALSIHPRNKYQSDGGPGMAEAFELLWRASTSPEADARALLRRFVFNYLIGNHDAHGKNFALLYVKNEGCRLAPAYDLLSTAIYPGLNIRMAMKIGKSTEADKVFRRHWMREIKHSGIPEREAITIIREMASEVPERLSQVAREFPAEAVSVIERIGAVVAERSERLLTEFSRIEQ